MHIFWDTYSRFISSKGYQKFKNYAPFVMLVISGLSGLCSSQKWYKEYFQSFLPDTIGYSLMVNFLLLGLYHPRKYCKTTILAVFGLITMNIVSIITIKLNHYNPIYDTAITLIVVSIVIYLRRHGKP